MPPILDTIDGLLRAFATRLVLSVAIVTSLLLIRMSTVLTIMMLVLFGAEVVLRGTLLWWRWRHHEARKIEAIVFGVVLLATLSFIPIAGPGSGLLLLGRVARLALLMTYWGPLTRDFVLIALQRERMSQIFLVLGLAAALTGSGAAILRMVDTAHTDIDGDGIEDDHAVEYFDLLWWSVRQVMDPGNLVPTTLNVGVLAVSLVLTTGGLLLIAVLIGMGSSLVEDLVRAGRARPVGLQQHTVVLNVADHSLEVLRNVTSYFEKQVRWRKVALQGKWDERPAFLNPMEFRSFHYRAGRPGDGAALELLNIEDARRVAILASGPDTEADADAVTAVLSARRLNEHAWIVVELNRPSNIPAALKAGQRHTVPVPARRLAALVLTQELVDPGRARLIQDFVSLEGQEIYTCLFGDGVVSHMSNTWTLDRPFAQIRLDVAERHRCLLLGYFVESGDRSTPWLRGISPVLNPPAVDELPTIRGVIALAERFQDVQNAVEAMTARTLPTALCSGAVVPTLPLRIEPEPDLKHVIVLGFHEDTVETVGEMLRLFPSCDITIVGEDEAERTRMRAAFLAERTETGARFEVVARKRLQVRNPDGGVGGTVNVRVADRFADGLFRLGDTDGPVGNLFDYDAAILLAERTRSSDPDGATTLGVLKLLDEWSAAADRRLVRVIAELVDRDKADLLRTHVQELALTESFSFVCTSLLRQNILSHSFFVPGLPPVLHNLITAGDEELFAFQPTQTSGRITFGQMLARMGRRTPPLVPVAVADQGGAILMNPPPEAELEWASLSTIYCLGTVDRAGPSD